MKVCRSLYSFQWILSYAHWFLFLWKSLLFVWLIVNVSAYILSILNSSLCIADFSWHLFEDLNTWLKRFVNLSHSFLCLFLLDIPLFWGCVCVCCACYCVVVVYVCNYVVGYRFPNPNTQNYWWVFISATAIAWLNALLFDHLLFPLRFKLIEQLNDI